MSEKTIQTASAGGVIVNNNDVLVVSQHGRTWSLPKGHIEPNETPLQTAYREIYEETGLLHLNYIKPLGSYKRYKIGKNPNQDDLSEEKTLHFFLFTTNQRHVQSQDTDNPDVCWVPIEQINSILTKDKDQEFFEKIKPQLYAYNANCIKIETTFPTKESAQQCTQLLISKQLAACCHLSPIESIYNWDNTIQTSTEYHCSIKTTTTLQDQCKAIINKHHPYDVPQFITTPINYLSPDYLDWFKSQLIT